MTTDIGQELVHAESQLADNPRTRCPNPSRDARSTSRRCETLEAESGWSACGPPHSLRDSNRDAHKASSVATRSTVIEAPVKQGQLRPQRHIPHARAYPIIATADEPAFRQCASQTQRTRLEIASDSPHREGPSSIARGPCEASGFTVRPGQMTVDVTFRSPTGLLSTDPSTATSATTGSES